MRKLLVKIVQILDGTPAVYGKRQSGQSVVELALITPILIILLAGLVEIGWFANNYLNLLDVTRAGARRGAVLQDQQSPLSWDNKYSYVPTSMLSDSRYWMTQNALNGFDYTADNTDRFTYRWMPAYTADSVTGLTTGNVGVQPCDPQYTDRVFYNEVICTMITTMDPLVLNPANGIDDIIVSGFSLQTVDPAYLPPGYAGETSSPISGPQVEVVGRYPSNANECDVIQDAGGNPVLSPRAGDEGRDPFDLNGNGMIDVAPPAVADPSQNQVASTFSEIAGYDAPPNFSTDANWEQDAEKQVGFSLFGNHKIPGTFCTGSEWTVSQVEGLANLPDYDMVSNDEKAVLPNQGLLLVEIYWEHEMLLKIPVLSPVYTAVGNQDGKMVISIWAAFPLGSVEPHIDFPPS